MLMLNSMHSLVKKVLPNAVLRKSVQMHSLQVKL